MAEPLSVARLVQIVRRFWLFILLFTLGGAAGGLGAANAMSPTYTATATQLVKALPGPGGTANYEASQFAVARAKSYPSFIYNDSVLDGVRGDLGNKESAADLRKDLTASNPVDTPLLELSAEGATAAEAQDKANSAARHLAVFISQIETIGGKSPIVIETAVQAARPVSPSSPQLPLYAAVAGFAGLAAALLIALGLSYRQSRQRRPSKKDGGARWWDETSDTAREAESAQPRALPGQPHPFGTDGSTSRPASKTRRRRSDLAGRSRAGSPWHKAAAPGAAANGTSRLDDPAAAGSVERPIAEEDRVEEATARGHQVRRS